MMKKTLIPALALVVASVALPAAAQSYGRGSDYRSWQSVNQRQAALDRRIDVGVRTGQISPREAARLRNEFRALARLEVSYRRNGLTNWERSDLDRRFDRLSTQIRYERRDGDSRRW